MRDLLILTSGALAGHRLRTMLSVLGIAVGIAAVTLLTSIGEGTRQYVLDEFSQFGTNIVSVTPGKTETIGIPGVLGGTTRKLSIDDALALQRVSGVRSVVPVAFGMARVAAGGRGRSVYVYGVTSDMPELWSFRVGLGSFLPPGDPRRGASVAAIGPKLARELFGDESALGERVRIGGTRLRVVGVMEPKGQFLGNDLDDVAYVPIATAMRIFKLDELSEIHFSYAHEHGAERVVADVRRLLVDRHQGEEDFTITTQQAMLDVFGNVMRIVTMAVGAIGGISLLVGAVGILTMMWIAVGERTAEIGLLRAVGAQRSQVLGLFLAEAAVLALLGGGLGLALGFSVAGLLRTFFPGIPLGTPAGYAFAALAVSVATGLASGVLPARRAARLDPIEALRAE